MSVSQAVAREVGDASSDAAANIRRTYFNMLDSFESELGKGREYGRATSEAARSDDNEDSIGENEFEPNFERGKPARKRCKLDFSCLQYASKNDIAPTISANLKHTNEVLES